MPFTGPATPNTGVFTFNNYVKTVEMHRNYLTKTAIASFRLNIFGGMKSLTETMTFNLCFSEGAF